MVCHGIFDYICIVFSQKMAMVTMMITHEVGFGVHDFQTYTHGMVGTCWY